MALAEAEAQMKKVVQIVLVLLLVAGLALYGYRTLKQPVTGVTTEATSDRMREFVAEHEKDESVLTTDTLQYNPASDPNRQQQVVTTDCFTLRLARPIAYLKTRSESSEETQQQQNCFIGGAFENPRAQLTISAEYRPDLTQLSEHTGITLRERESDEYQPIEVPEIAGEEYRAFQSQIELIVIWSRTPVVYTVALHNLARESDDAQKLFRDVILALELDEGASDSVY